MDELVSLDEQALRQLAPNGTYRDGKLMIAVLNSYTDIKNGDIVQLCLFHDGTVRLFAKNTKDQAIEEELPLTDDLHSQDWDYGYKAVFQDDGFGYAWHDFRGEQQRLVFNNGRWLLGN